MFPTWLLLLTLFNLFSGQNTFSLEFTKSLRCFNISVATFQFNPLVLWGKISKKILVYPKFEPRNTCRKLQNYIILKYQKICAQ